MSEPLKPIKSMSELITRLASRFCSYDEISVITGLSISEIQKNYLKEVRLGFANSKVNIRQRQLKKALDEGNVQMLIWLGKQYLGQSDKMQTYLEAEVNQTIRIGWADEAAAFVTSGAEVIDTKTEMKSIEQLNDEMAGKNLREEIGDQLSIAVQDESSKDIAEL